jgi:hypothetical protein
MSVDRAYRGVIAFFLALTVLPLAGMYLAYEAIPFLARLLIALGSLVMLGLAFLTAARGAAKREGDGKVRRGASVAVLVVGFIALALMIPLLALLLAALPDLVP